MAPGDRKLSFVEKMKALTGRKDKDGKAEEKKEAGHSFRSSSSQDPDREKRAENEKEKPSHWLSQETMSRLPKEITPNMPLRQPVSPYSTDSLSIAQSVPTVSPETSAASDTATSGAYPPWGPSNSDFLANQIPSPTPLRMQPSSPYLRGQAPRYRQPPFNTAHYPPLSAPLPQPRNANGGNTLRGNTERGSTSPLPHAHPTTPEGLTPLTRQGTGAEDQARMASPPSPGQLRVPKRAPPPRPFVSRSPFDIREQRKASQGVGQTRSRTEPVPRPRERREESEEEDDVSSMTREMDMMRPPTQASNKSSGLDPDEWRDYLRRNPTPDPTAMFSHRPSQIPEGEEAEGTTGRRE